MIVRKLRYSEYLFILKTNDKRKISEDKNQIYNCFN